MPYTIGTIVYGLNFCHNELLPYREDIDILVDEGIVQDNLSEELDYPCYLGVPLDEFDECGDIVVSKLKLIPTLEQIDQFKDLLDRGIKLNISPEFLDILIAMEPVVFITWSHS